MTPPPLAADEIRELRREVELDGPSAWDLPGKREALLAACERAAELERFLEEHGDSVEHALRFSEEQYQAIQHLDATVRDDLARREKSIEAFRALREKP